jgi:hypothetical protein
MKTCRIKLSVELEIDAFTVEDAVDVAKDSVYDLEGLGVTVIDVTVTDRSCRW